MPIGAEYPLVPVQEAQEAAVPVTEEIVPSVMEAADVIDVVEPGIFTIM